MGDGRVPVPVPVPVLGRLVPDILRSSARSSPSANTTRRLKLGGTSLVDRASALRPRADAAPPVSPLADALSGASSSSSSSPYLARLYRSPSARPFSSRTVGSEPGAGSLMRYLIHRGGGGSDEINRRRGAAGETEPGRAKKMYDGGRRCGSPARRVPRSRRPPMVQVKRAGAPGRVRSAQRVRDVNRAWKPRSVRRID